MDSNKVCFIINTNNDTFLNECELYLTRLIVPEGFKTELLTIQDAQSMLAGYREACDATDALYKVFLHQDVFILNRRFIEDFLQIFGADHRIGMVGMIGAPKMPDDFIMWSSKRVGNQFLKGDDTDYQAYKYRVEQDGYDEVEVADGFLIVIKGEPILRDDLFDGWDFYDVSMSMEMRRAGKKVVVPRQTKPWCLHDDGGLLSMFSYDYYRKIAMQEYRCAK